MVDSLDLASTALRLPAIKGQPCMLCAACQTICIAHTARCLSKEPCITTMQSYFHTC